MSDTPIDAVNAGRRSGASPALRGAEADPRIAEAIRRRQTSLLVRYVAIVRAR